MKTPKCRKCGNALTSEDKSKYFCNPCEKARIAHLDDAFENLVNEYERERKKRNERGNT